MICLALRLLPVSTISVGTFHHHGFHCLLHVGGRLQIIIISPELSLELTPHVSSWMLSTDVSQVSWNEYLKSELTLCTPIWTFICLVNGLATQPVSQARVLDFTFRLRDFSSISSLRVSSPSSCHCLVRALWNPFHGLLILDSDFASCFQPRPIQYVATRVSSLFIYLF